ncbi:MAG: hypothetical protein H6739_12230 [Alphaproteobacteria bacterium]|nr:hypothetical protein [Alphaproteobacteria bacterium]
MTERLPRLLVALACAALIAALGFDLVAGPLGLSGGLLGDEGVDQYGTQWFYWFTAEKLLAWESPARAEVFFHPWGKDIYAHTGANVLDAVLAVPLRAALGPVLGYNAFVLLGMAFNAWAWTRLARAFTDDPVAIGVTAVLFATSPYILYEVAEGRPTQAILGLLPLFWLQVWRAGLQPGLRAPLFAGVLLALNGLMYWFYAFFGGIVCLAHGLVRIAWPPEGAGGRAAVLARHALIAGVALALVAPFALPLAMRAATASDTVPGLLDVDQWGLVQIPPVTAEGFRIGVYTWQPLLGQSGFFMLDEQGAELFTPVHEMVGGLELLVLLAGVAVARRVDRRALLAMTLAAALLALGPLLVVGGLWYPNPVYIVLVKLVGFLRRLWWPGRAWALGTIGVWAFGAIVLGWLGQRQRWAQAAAAVGLVLWTGVRHHQRELLPFPLWDPTIPAGYRCLAEGPPGAIIELPYAWNQAHVYYQTAHGRPILGGMIEDNPLFSPPESRELREHNTFLRALLAYDPQATTLPPWTDEDKQAVYDLGYRYVVLQKAAYGLGEAESPLVRRARETHLRRTTRGFQAMMGRPVFDGEDVVIYAPWGDGRPCGG